ncbi:LexA family protein [uncultured Enterovirga sp.]|uniref:LexA family protein n=1 Tax=uncultured Enterovirga sp. TaxID=2026352 RepID=UPI0035CACE5B
MSADAIRDIFRRPENSITLETIEKLAVGLQTTPEWLAYGSGANDDEPPKRPDLAPANRSFSLARVDGRVQAGNWVEVDVYDGDQGEVISAPRDPDFPFARQIAYRVGGDSMNRAEPRPIRDGDYVICVAFEDTGLRPVNGMNVVVQRTRDDGQMRERSVKEIRLLEDRTEFVPRSDNPAHKPIVVPGDRDPSDTTVVEILSLVRFVFDNMPVPIPSGAS